MREMQFKLWKPNRWGLLIMCVLAVLICLPWLGVLAFLFGDELHALARRVLRRHHPPTISPAIPPPSGVLVADSLSAGFGFRRFARLRSAVAALKLGKSDRRGAASAASAA